VEPEVGVDILLERMSEREEEFSVEEQTKRFLHVECDKAIELANTPVQSQPTDLSQFVEDPDFLYQDFQRRGEITEIPTFRVQVLNSSPKTLICEPICKLCADLFI